MEKEKTIDVLNELVVINNDRIEGYEEASENTAEKGLKDLFSEFRRTSQKCRNELISEISKLGGKAEEGTKASGRFFRTWMDVKSVLSGKDRKAILNSCEYGEEQADETYQTVLNDESEHLSLKQQAMIKAQHNLLRTDLNKIKLLKNSLVEA